MINNTLCYKTDSNYIFLFFPNRQSSETMTTQAILRVILGPDSSQRLVFSAGLPSTVAELETNIKIQCKIMKPFRLQFMDMLFGNKFVNLTSMEEIQDKATLKVVYTSCQPQDQGEPSFSFSSTSAPDDTSSCSGDSTVILSSPESVITGFMARFVLCSPFHIRCGN